MAHLVREYDLPTIIEHDRRNKDGRPHEGVKTEAISQRINALLPKHCARSTSAAHSANGWRHATDPPDKRLRPRTAATARGPNSKTNTLIYATSRDTRKASSFAYGAVCPCSCATASDDFATASAAGIPVFLIRLTPALGRDGRPSCDPFRALPRRTATLSGFCDVTLTDLKLQVLDVGLFEKDGRRRASLPSKPVESVQAGIELLQRDCEHEP
jgi:hypothetical protein